VFKSPEGHSVTVAYEGSGPAARVARVNDGSRTYIAEYDAGGNLTGLRVGLQFYSTQGAGKNADSIVFNNETKGFTVRLDAANHGTEIEFDPSRRSERVTTTGLDGRTLTTETFGTGTNSYKVVTEVVNGERVVRSFTDKNGREFTVQYKDTNNPKPGEVQTIKDSTGRAIPEIAQYGATKITVTPEGVVRLENGAGVNVEKHPHGRLVYSSPSQGYTTDERARVVETVVPRTRPRPEGGLTLERGAPSGSGHVVRNLTIKDTGATLTQIAGLNRYEYRANPDAPARIFAGRITVDANGLVKINNGLLLADGRNVEQLLANQGGDARALPPRRPVSARAQDSRIDLPARRVTPSRLSRAQNLAHFDLTERKDGLSKYKDGTTVEVTRDGDGNKITTVTRPGGQTTTYVAGSDGKLISITNSDGTSLRRTDRRCSRPGCAVWEDQNHKTSVRRTEGNGLGVDRNGCLHYQVGGYASLRRVWVPGTGTMTERQYRDVQATGEIPPMPIKPHTRRLPAPGAVRPYTVRAPGPGQDFYATSGAYVRPGGGQIMFF
jgi:YD repeat-containing protein